MNLLSCRGLTSLLFAAALAMAACDGGSESSGGGVVNYTPVTTDCSQFTTCETCTAPSGCGWCYDVHGGGLCASSSSECTAQTLTWTWSLSGCRVAAIPTTGDAGGGVLDAASSPKDATSGADAADSGSSASSDASSADAIATDAVGPDAIATDAQGSSD